MKNESKAMLSAQDLAGVQKVHKRISNNDALATSIDDFVNIFVLNTV